MVARIGKSFVMGWKGLMGFVLFLVAIWPFLVCIALGVVLIMKYQRNKTNKPEQKP